MRRLFPAAPGPDACRDREWEPSEIAEAYAYPPAAAQGAPDGGWLRANMVSSVDGAAHHGGHSRPLSSAADMRVFGVLRQLADVVIVGAETVREEGYRPVRPRPAFAERRAAAGQAPVPAIAVVSSSLRLDFSLPLFAEPLVPTLLLTGAKAPRAELERARAAGVQVIVAGEGTGAEPTRVKAELARRGLVRMLTEGGPRLLGQLLAAGVVDELCLSWSPRYAVGGAARIAGGPELDAPGELRLTDVLEDSGFLFTRYRRR